MYGLYQSMLKNPGITSYTSYTNPSEIPKCHTIKRKKDYPVKDLKDKRIQTLKTRFDNTKTWETSAGATVRVVDLETTHALNLLRMFYRKPTMLQSFLLNDIQGSGSSPVWTKNGTNNPVESINNITSMSIDDCIEYWENCPLFHSIVCELGRRGVNVPQMLRNFREEESFRIITEPTTEPATEPATEIPYTTERSSN